jgi:hypothetical protein
MKWLLALRPGFPGLPEIIKLKMTTVSATIGRQFAYTLILR